MSNDGDLTIDTKSGVLNVVSDSGAVNDVAGSINQLAHFGAFVKAVPNAFIVESKFGVPATRQVTNAIVVTPPSNFDNLVHFAKSPSGRSCHLHVTFAAGTNPLSYLPVCQATVRSITGLNGFGKRLIANVYGVTTTGLSVSLGDIANPTVPHTECNEYEGIDIHCFVPVA